MPASVSSPTRRIVALALSGGAVLTGLAAAPATAAPVCSSTIDEVLVRDTSLTVGAKSTENLDLVAAVSTACAVSRVDVTVTSPAGSATFPAKKVDKDTSHTYWGVSVSLKAANLANADAGTWTTKVSAKSGTTVTRSGPSVKVLRASRLSANASPEPVRKNKTITVSGKLERLNWETGHYAGYADRKVQLQVRSPKGTTYRTVKTVGTGKGGAIKTMVKATKDGCYRFAFSGSGNTASAKAKGDCIDVR